MKVIDPVKWQFCIRKGEQPNAPRFYYCTAQDVILGLYYFDLHRNKSEGLFKG